MTEKKEPEFIIGAPADWPVVERRAGEKLIRVALGHGASIKLPEAEARRRGLLPDPAAAEAKAQPPAPNKRRRGAANKQQPDRS